ncbi:hypothetical protein BX661DRAFT_69702 [Kickxella alabastrina]|uniref:uncharacterized protein n=1 Tax=Kickxella alabastrina TaxID=61397 RepID=UPI00221EB892|nr:uncharacterized protein BX661DRAFT_69702 [Kickxella alabastrina]KAI7820730.1 hypothetical protein BX661DRAFT_69702 [Kickxella alabastrina]
MVAVATQRYRQSLVFLTSLFLLFCALFAAPAYGRKPRVPGARGRLLVFGESLVDPGNLYTFISHLFPSAPYYQGRWSNGPTFVEYLSDLQCRSMENYAFGGATTNNGNITALPVKSLVQMPSTDQQVKLFNLYHMLTVSGSAYKDDVAVFTAGANEIFRSVEGILAGTIDPDYLPFMISSNLKGQMLSLKEQGVSRFILFSLPPIDDSPRSKLGNYPDAIRDTVNRINIALEKVVVEIREEDKLYETDPKRRLKWIQYVSFRDIINVLEQKPILEALNIKSTRLPCLKTLKYDVDLGSDFYNFLELVTHANTIPVCENPDEYFYWDASHFSAQIHRIIGYVLDEAVDRLEAGEYWNIDADKVLGIIKDNELNTPIVLPKGFASTPFITTLFKKYPIFRLGFRVFML